MKKISNRIHRLTGQLEKIEQAIVAEEPCEKVLPQLLATKGALDATVRAYLESAMDSCAKDADRETMQQVIKLFIKHT